MALGERTNSLRRIDNFLPPKLIKGLTEFGEKIVFFLKVAWKSRLLVVIVNPNLVAICGGDCGGGGGGDGDGWSVEMNIAFVKKKNLKNVNLMRFW